VKSALKKAIAGRLPKDWAQHQANSLLNSAGQDTPEVDLSPILKRRRVYKTVPEDERLNSEARLIPDEKGFVIRNKRNRHQGNRRARFSTAHELGHTFFYDLDRDPPRRLSGLPYPDEQEEWICNLFATHLLMPADMVRHAYNNIKSSNSESDNIPILQLVCRLSNIFCVSIDAICIRIINELKLWEGVIVKCRWLPKTKNNHDYKWRISNAFYDKDSYPNLFIPYKNSYVSGNPSLKWNAAEKLSTDMKPAETRNISIPRNDVYHTGNLLGTLQKLKGPKLFYNVSAMLLERERPNRSIYDYKLMLTNKKRLNKVFLFSIEL